MSFDIGHTTFGFTMRVPDSDVAAVDELISSHAAWMQKTHSLTEVEGKLHTLEYYVSKAAELNDMMDPQKAQQVTSFILLMKFIKTTNILDSMLS